jgi:hypothetical protein
MVHVELICSDDQCTERFEAYGELADLEALACDCGCGLVIVRWLAELPADPATADVSLLSLAA